jgi:hypothetical protein
MENISSGLRAVKTASSLDLEVLKLPKGVLKIVQFVLALITFAALASFDSQVKFEKKCPSSPAVHKSLAFEYPFVFWDYSVSLPLCEETVNVTQTRASFSGNNVSSSPRFFVFTGVVSFLYSALALACYLFVAELLQSKSQFGFKLDVVVHVVLTVLWFGVSCALIKAGSDIKNWTAPKHLYKNIPECLMEPSCTTLTEPNYAEITLANLSFQ